MSDHGTPLRDGGSARPQGADANQGAASGDDTPSTSRQVIKDSNGFQRVIRSESDISKIRRIPVRYVSRIMNSLPPAKMFSDILVAQLPEPVHTILPEISFVWKHESEMKPYVLNARAITDAWSRQQVSCPCAAYPDKFKNVDHEGARHLCTYDLSAIRDPGLSQLLSKGLNHIPLQPWDEQAAENALYEAAAAGLDIIQTISNIFSSQDEATLQAVLKQSVHDWVQHQLSKSTAIPDTAEFTPQLQQSLSLLRQTVWLCEVDKAPNNLCLLCPVVAMTLIETRLRSGSDFVHLPLTSTSTMLLQQMQQSLNDTDSCLVPLLDTSAPLPLLRVTYKSHKQPAGWRFITNAASSALESINEVAASICALLLDELTLQCQVLSNDIKTWYNLDTHPCTMVINAQQVSINMPSKISMDFTADITKCFEAIPIQQGIPYSILDVLHSLVNKLFQRHHSSDPRLAVYPQKPKVLMINKAGSSPTAAYLNCEQTMAFLDLVIQYAYVQCGSNIFCQVNGIPMGASYSPTLCNLYLLYYELAACKRQLQLIPDPALKLQVITQWTHYMRMVDDIRLINAPMLSQWITNPVQQGLQTSFQWIYPPPVIIEVTGTFILNEPGQTYPHSIHYLDLTTHIFADGSFALDLYSKDSKLPFKPLRYYQAISNRPAELIRTVAIGQTFRILYLTSHRQYLQPQFKQLIRDMRDRGFNTGRILHQLKQWLLNNKPFPLVNENLVSALLHLCRHHRWIRHH